MPRSTYFSLSLYHCVPREVALTSAIKFAPEVWPQTGHPMLREVAKRAGFLSSTRHSPVLPRLGIAALSHHFVMWACFRWVRWEGKV